MDSLFSLPYEVQIVLLAGYLGYKTSVAGRTMAHRSEDFVLQVLVYGSIGRVIGSFSMSVPAVASMEETKNFAIVAAFSIAAAVVVAAAWRAKGQGWWTWVMAKTSVFHDDLEPSTWVSMTSASALWNHVHIHCADGKIYESEFSKFSAFSSRFPTNDIILNEDGVLMYVTKIYRDDDSEMEFDLESEDGVYIAEYFPRAQIKRLTVGWAQR